MKAIDFSKPGGFPLTQNQLNYLQQAYTEAIKALAMVGQSGTSPYIINGVTITNPSSGAYTATNGWVFYNNELIRFVPGSIAGASGGFEPYVVITPSATTLVYHDGSTPSVIQDKDASLQVLPTGTVADATKFPLSSLRPFGAGLGELNREMVWNTLVVNTPAAEGGVTGTLYYKKNHLTNTLHIRGTLSAANAQNFAGMPGSLFYLMGTLPTGYRPNNNVYFSAQYLFASSIKDDVASDWIKQLNSALNTSGQLYIGWLKPALPATTYSVVVNTILPLD
jgi:hypothetical protein